MLFDLRSKSRRNTVRVVYVILALLMLSGLLLVGVGTGNNNGGILNALSNNGGSTSGQNALINQATSAAIKATQKHPGSASAWEKLVQARYTAAGTGSNYNTTTDTYTEGAKAQLNDGVTAWNKYLSLTNNKPDVNTSLLAGKIYEALKQWSNAGDAWEYVIQSQAAGSPDAIRGYECLALNAFAAGGQTSKGELAAAAAKKLLPKAEQTEWTTTVTSAKSSATTAAADVTEDC